MRILLKLSVAPVFGMIAISPAFAQSVPASLDCVVHPSETLKLGSPVVGIVSELLVERGAEVKAGQIIARMDSRIEVAQLSASRSRLDYVRDQMNRAEELFKREAIPESRLDELRGEFNIQRSEYNRAEALVKSREIRSPISGVVTERHSGPGEFISQEGALVTVAQLSPLHVETLAPISLHDNLKVGDRARVTLQQPVGGAYDATIITLDRVYDSASGTFRVRLELPNEARVLPAGIRCDVALGVS